MSSLKIRLIKVCIGQILFRNIWVYVKKRLGLRTEGEKDFDLIYKKSKDPWLYESSPYEAKKYAETLSLLKEKKYQRVLEVACSIGVFTEKLAEKAEFLQAIDFSTVAVERAKERCKGFSHVYFTVCDLLKYKSSKAFQLIICAEMLYYFPRRYEATVSKKIAKLLEPNGELVIVMEAGQGERWRQCFIKSKIFIQTEHRLYLHPDRPYEIRIFKKLY